MTVKEKLTADPDSEIATTSLRVSLLCPVSCCGFFLIPSKLILIKMWVFWDMFGRGSLVFTCVLTLWGQDPVLEHHVIYPWENEDSINLQTLFKMICKHTLKSVTRSSECWDKTTLSGKVGDQTVQNSSSASVCSQRIERLLSEINYMYVCTLSV